MPDIASCLLLGKEWLTDHELNGEFRTDGIRDLHHVDTGNEVKGETGCAGGYRSLIYECAERIKHLDRSILRSGHSSVATGIYGSLERIGCVLYGSVHTVMDVRVWSVETYQLGRFNAIEEGGAVMLAFGGKGINLIYLAHDIV